MLYVQLDTNWPDHHKIIDAGVDGAGAHAILLCLAKRLESDGWVRRSLLRRYGIDAELIDRLVDLVLIDADGDRVRPHGWLDRNPSQAAIDASRAMKKQAGRQGNHDRWHPGVPFESCEKCQVIAGSDRTGSHPIAGDNSSDPIPTSRGRVPTEVATAIPAAIDLTPPPTPRIDDTHKQLAASALSELRYQLKGTA